MQRFILALAVIGLLASLAPAAEPARKPNIVLILADDLGWKDVGYQGTDFYETPNIDALAKRGMVFPSAYAGAGNCAPSRACLLSGQYTPRHHVYAVGDTDRGPKPLMRMIPIPNKSGLPKSLVTMSDALKDVGYKTGIFGKWHLGGKDGTSPKEQGFDVVFDSRTPDPNAKRDEPDDPKGAYSLTKAACEFMEVNKDKPFFVYLPHHAIHSALEARPASLKKFQAKESGKQHKNALYAACLYDLDDAVGVLLKKIETLGLTNDTLVIFTSDNGGTQQSSQEPLRGNKGCYYEGGIREPFIACWPGKITPGTTCDVPIHNVDLFPTFLATAGAKVPKDVTLDGENLLPLFGGEKKLKRDAIFWHFPGYLDSPVIRGRDPVFRTRPVSAIRKGDWKLLLYHEEWQLDGGKEKIASNNAVELYDLKSDIGERKNLAATDTKKRDELLADLLNWIEATKAPLPTKPNPDYNPAAAPPKKGKP
jgi:arylsulfatase A-like enzyme